MAVSTPISLRLPPEAAAELARIGRLTGRAPASVATRFIEEALRMREIPGVMFVDVPNGRCASIIGTGLMVWEMCDLLESYGSDRERMLADFPHLTASQADAALRYRALYPEEIDAHQEENRRIAAR